MVAAIQLLQQAFATSEEERQLAQSKFDLMKLTLIKHQEFWNNSLTPLQNLTALSLRLNPLATRMQTSTERPVETTNTVRHLHSNATEESSRGVDQPGNLQGLTGANTHDFAGNAVSNFQCVEETPELFSGSLMDGDGFQAYMDSILSNKWTVWNDAMDLGNFLLDLV
jgi:hypothetical protein